MSTIKADISIRLDIEVEAESYDVAKELIHQFVFVGSDDKSIDTAFGFDLDVNSMESDDIEEED